MNYAQIFDRWISLSTLSEADRASLMDHLHGEIKSGTQTLAMLASNEMGLIVNEVQYDSRDAYLKAVLPVMSLASLDGYLLFLIEKGINPDTANLVGNKKTDGVGKLWSTGYEKDQHKAYMDAIDPIIRLMLNKIYELRVNQALSFHPEIVELPYKVTEKLHQYIGWCVHQGYILGCLEHGIQ